jgi:hypothetical protein
MNFNQVHLNKIIPKINKSYLKLDKHMLIYKIIKKRQDN